MTIWGIVVALCLACMLVLAAQRLNGNECNSGSKGWREICPIAKYHRPITHPNDGGYVEWLKEYIQ